MRRAPLIAAGVAWFLAAAAAAGLAVWPCAYTGESTTGGPSGTIRAGTCASFIEVNGPSVLVVLAIPVALATLVVIAVWAGARTFGWAATTVLGLFSLAAGFSVGLFFLPAGVASIVAMFRWKPRGVRQKTDAGRR